jgi:hypothetical protein
MASRSQTARSNTALVRRALATARKEIEHIEKKFHQTVRSLQPGTGRSPRRPAKGTTARTRIAAGSRTGRAAPVQTAITKVLSKRRRGLTMERLQEALPQFDQKSHLNATFAMRR